MRLGRPAGTSAGLITYVTDRPGHDARYAIDPTKLETELGGPVGDIRGRTELDDELVFAK